MWRRLCPGCYGTVWRVTRGGLPSGGTNPCHDETGDNEIHGCGAVGGSEDRERGGVLPGERDQPADVLPAPGADRGGGLVAAPVAAAADLPGADPGRGR